MQENLCDQSIKNLTKQLDKARKTSIGKADNYTTGCLLDYTYFKDNYKLITVDLSKQKPLMMLQGQLSKQYFKELLEELMVQK